MLIHQSELGRQW